MLIDADLSKVFWAEAAITAVYLLNFLPRKKGKSANEKFNGEKVDIKQLKIFGQKCMVHIPKEKRHKLDDKSEECLFMGYEPNGYRVYDSSKNKIIVSRDVVFIDDLKQEIVVSHEKNIAETENENILQTIVEEEQGCSYWTTNKEEEEEIENTGARSSKNL